MTTLEGQGHLAPAGDRANATRTVAAALRRALVVAPDATAVVCGDRSSTYRELAARVRRLTGALAALGLGRGDRVAVLSANSDRYLELYLALPAAGYVIVPLNFRHSAAERHYALADSGARVLLGFKGSSQHLVVEVLDGTSCWVDADGSAGDAVAGSAAGSA